MKILQFTLPVRDNKTIIVKEERHISFYPYLHRHEEVQLTWVVKGEGTLLVDNAMHSFHPNEIYWIGANQSHVFKSVPACSQQGEPMKKHTVDIYFSIDKQLSSFFSIPEMKSLKDFVGGHGSGFRLPQACVENISARMKAVLNSFGVEQFLQFINLLKQIASLEISESLSRLSQRPDCYSDFDGIRFAAIYNYVMEHYNKHLSLDEVSKVAYMSPQAFCRYFKKYTDQTLIDFVNQVRIGEACKMLVDKGYGNITAIAFDTGFNSISNFNRVFKSIVNKSPRAYIDSYYQHVTPRHLASRGQAG